jgi:hypothetical protein
LHIFQLAVAAVVEKWMSRRSPHLNDKTSDFWLDIKIGGLKRDKLLVEI